MAQPKFLDENGEKQVIEAIRQAENKTSGEIRIHVEAERPKKQEIQERALYVFHELKMDATDLHNGVLIYLAFNDHEFYILGDKGIHEKVPENFWKSTRDVMQEHFKKGDFKNGLREGVEKAGDQLKTHFPVADDDINELSDEISRN